jgi:hypothetical protein
MVFMVGRIILRGGGGGGRELCFLCPRVIIQSKTRFQFICCICCICCSSNQAFHSLVPSFIFSFFFQFEPVPVRRVWGAVGLDSTPTNSLIENRSAACAIAPPFAHFDSVSVLFFIVWSFGLIYFFAPFVCVFLFL